MTRRFFAFAADCVILVALYFTLVALIVFGNRDPSDQAIGAMVRLAFIAWLIYMIMAPYFTSMTLGKYLLSIEIRSSRAGQSRPAIWELAMRETVFRWMSFVMLLGYIPAFYDPRRRTWSDRWANTVVVRRDAYPRRWVIVLFAIGLFVILITAALALLNRP